MRKLLLESVAVALFACTSYAQSVTPQQSAGNGQSISASSISQAFPLNTTAGNTIIVAVTAYGATVTQVTDTLGNRYLNDLGLVGGRSYIFRASNIVGGPDTVTAIFSGPASGSIHIVEYSGLATSSALDVAIGASGSDTAVGCSNLTTANPKDLLVVYARVKFTLTSTDPNYTATDTAYGDWLGGRSVNAAGTYTASFRQDPAGTFECLLAAYKLASGAGADPLQITTMSVPSSTLNAPYNIPLAASGGTSPYMWSLASGSLPTGLSLTSAGQISGAPTSTGMFRFTAQVKDSVNAMATQSFIHVVRASSYPGIFTSRNDNARTGQNRNEVSLTPAAVKPTTFGKLFSYPVDGQIYAQPLYVSGVQIPGQGARNVVYVATEHDSVYAFDADGRTAAPLWQVSFINPAAGITTVSNSDVECPDIGPEIGITGTPVIDPQSSTLYVVARTKENGNFVHRLHALDITTGAEKFGGPVVIQASVRGTAADSDANGNVLFNPLRANQRSALLLSRSFVYVAFGSLCDNDPYHGWMLGYNASTLQQAAVFNTTPNAMRGGIWQSGGGLSADSGGNIFAVTGNGTFDANRGGVDMGDSVLRFSTNVGGLTLADFFTPFNQDSLELWDLDLGSSAPLLLPDQPGTHPHLVVVGGKEGKLYLLDRDDLGKFHSGDDSQIVQSFFVSSNGIFSTPAFWENNIYVLGNADDLKSFRLSGGRLSATPTSRSGTVFNYPGATPAISSNGSTDGIVWVLKTTAFFSGGPALLYAYDATDVSRQLYNSNQAGTRDEAGPAVKFTVPTVADGKVYVGTKTQLAVFGLLP